MEEITNFEELNTYLLGLKARNIGDNGERSNTTPPPCCFVFANDKKEIDKPFFHNPEDWKTFWGICKKEYPLHSVYGGNSHSTKENIESSEAWNFSNIIKKKINNDKLLSGNVLEIGPGFGGAGRHLMNTYKSNYFGIDYVLSNPEDVDYTFEGKKRFYEINVSGIPEELKNINYNLIFSTNVFQHLTQQQRFDYIKEAYECLEKDGVLYFDVFEGKKDVELPKNFATSFFMVHTKVDTEDELMSCLKETGFSDIEKGTYNTINNTTDWVYYKCVKSSK